MIRFVIPAYNEAENIPRLLADLAPVARELGARVIIVDDGSTDGTGEVIREHAQDMHLAVGTPSTAGSARRSTPASARR